MRFVNIFVTNILLLSMLIGCSVGHKDFVNFRDDVVGEVMKQKAPYRYLNSGEFIRGNYVKSGQGLTEITKDKDGNLIYHIFVQEVLANTRTEKGWVGKCLIYYVVEPATYVIKSWGFENGGNPLSCRTWP
jgi:hypothetical protein